MLKSRRLLLFQSIAVLPDDDDVCRRCTFHESSLLLFFARLITPSAFPAHVSQCTRRMNEMNEKAGKQAAQWGIQGWPLTIAGFEHAMRKWRAKLFHHGVQLGHGNRVTNIRYAGDPMLVATSANDDLYVGNFGSGVCSLRLKPELGEGKKIDNISVGQFWVCWCLWRNAASNSCWISAPILGQSLTGNFLARKDMEFSHRLQVAWNKFQKYKDTLLNKNISLVVRLKLFDTVVSPAMFSTDKGLLAETWCRAKAHASFYSWVGSNSWWPELAGHYGANES